MLACREESHPQCVWIWDVAQAKLLTVIVFVENITMSTWKHQPQVEGPQMALEAQVLTVCTGTSRIYFWNAADGASFAELPSDISTLRAQSLQCSSNGNTMVIHDKEAVCIMTF